MRNSLVRPSLPLFLLVGALLFAALILAGKPSAVPMYGAAPAQNGFAKPEVRQAGPVQPGFARPTITSAGPVQAGSIRLAAGPHSTPLTIPYIFAAATPEA